MRERVRETASRKKERERREGVGGGRVAVGVLLYFER